MDCRNQAVEGLFEEYILLHFYHIFISNEQSACKYWLINAFKDDTIWPKVMVTFGILSD